MKTKLNYVCFREPGIKKSYPELKVLTLFACLLFFQFVFLSDAFSQQPFRVSGKVSDATTGVPLPGANVLLEGTTNGVITDLQGEYNIQVPGESALLKFSFVGYTPQVIAVGNRTNINVSLSESTEKIEELVVVGYGTQKKMSVTGAIGTIQAEEIVKSPVSSVQNALVGRSAGLIMVQRSGAPGGDFADIFIRGRATYGNSNPLILVDGIERDITTLDPNEVESVNILKDASATAVFGVRGANGVIVITTKTGSLANKPLVTFSANYGFSTPIRLPRFLNAAEYARFNNAASRNDNILDTAWVAPFTDEDIRLYESGEDPIFHPDNDWMDILVRKNTPQQKYNLNISGGNEKAKYFVNLGYMNQEGILGGLQFFDDIPVNANLKRYNIRANTDFQWTKNFSTAVKFSTQITKGINTNYVVGQGDFLHHIFVQVPITTLPYFNGKVISDTPEISKYSTNRNPFWNYSDNYTLEYEARTTIDISTVYKLDEIIEGLSVRGKFAYDNYYSQFSERRRSSANYEIRRTKPGYEGGVDGDYFTLVQMEFDGPFTANEKYSSNYRLYSEAAIDYNHTFTGGHTFTGLFLGTMERSFRGGSPALPYNYMGVVGRTTYNYKRRYMAEFNMGYNGSENFAKGKQFGFFPSYSLGYVISEESFFPENNILTFLKIRGSRGKVGNDKSGVGRFLYTPSSYDYSTGGQYDIHFGDKNNRAPGFYSEDKIGNPNISWEVATKSNLGLEMRFFNDALSFSGDLFSENRKDILGKYNNVPFTFGDLSILPTYNLGIVENKGYEIEAGYKYTSNKDFKFWINGNYTFARNKIIFNDEIPKEFPNLITTGKPIGQPFMLISNGFYNTWEEVNDPLRIPTKWDAGTTVQPGDLSFEDINEDGFIDENDRMAYGYTYVPEIIYGINIGLNWKNFDVSILLQGTEHVSNYYGLPILPVGDKAARTEADYDAWTVEKYERGDEILWPRLYNKPGGPSQQTNSYMNQDASYFRLKNMEIGYTLNPTFTRRIGIQKLRIYTNGNNLFTLSKMKYWDPESLRNTDKQYPVTRVVNFGLKANF